MKQTRMIMHISYITEPLSAALRTLFATLVLLVFPMVVWGQEEPSYTGSGTGTDVDPYLVTSADQLTEVFQTYGGNAKLTATITGCFTYL